MTEVITLTTDRDVLRARQRGRELAAQLGFSSLDLTLVATAISEIARNVITYAKRGRMTMSRLEQGERIGFEIVSEDEGPGIANVEQALRDGFSTSRSLGMGLPGCRRIMDEFEIETGHGQGTTVTMRKWLQKALS